MRANGSFAIRGNAEFFVCGMWQSDNGQFAERSALDFPQVTPLDNFPQSSFCKIPMPAGMLSTAKSANVGFRLVMQLFAPPTNPAMHLVQKFFL